MFTQTLSLFPSDHCCFTCCCCFLLQLRHNTKCFHFNCFPEKRGHIVSEKSWWNSSKLEEACSRRQNGKSASWDNIQVSWRAKPKCIHLIWITWMFMCSISLHRNIRYLWCFHITDCGGQEGKLKWTMRHQVHCCQSISCRSWFTAGKTELPVSPPPFLH